MEQSHDEAVDYEDGAPAFIRGDLAPEFLERNAHVHDWAFGALAELVDNSVDAGATIVGVDLTGQKFHNKPIKTLSIHDNGTGMSGAQLQKMLVGFGRTTKGDGMSIGQYGVGFKSGSMRLGQDCMVLTRCDQTQELSIGLLSLTWLLAEARETVEAVVITWRTNGELVTPDASGLFAILQEYALDRLEVDDIIGSFNRAGLKCNGTAIYLWNLKKREDGKDELNKIGVDILLSTKSMRENVLIDHSLRSYLEVIYLKPKVTLLVGQEVVAPKPIAKELTKRKKYKFNLVVTENKEMMHEAMFGFSENARKNGLYGLFMYHRNRLIASYKTEGALMSEMESGRVVGIIGQVDASEYLTVMHNKQGFRSTAAYANFQVRIGELFKKYWMNTIGKTYQQHSDTSIKPDGEVDWVQCDSCGKWRYIPEGDRNVKSFKSEVWMCYMNTDKAHNHCNIPEEKDHASYNDNARFIDTVDENKKNRKRPAPAPTNPVARRQAKTVEPAVKRARQTQRNDVSEHISNRQAGGKKRSSREEEEEDEEEEDEDREDPVEEEQVWEGDLKDHQTPTRVKQITHLESSRAIPNMPKELLLTSLRKAKELPPFTATELSKAVYMFLKHKHTNDTKEFIRLATYMKEHERVAEIPLDKDRVLILIPPTASGAIDEDTRLRGIIRPSRNRR